MTSGPVNEGSITAYVRADAADFKSAMAEVQAITDKVAESDPTVTVHARTGEALTALAAVQAAQDALNDPARDSRGSAPLTGIDGLRSRLANVALPESFAVNDLQSAQRRLKLVTQEMTRAESDLNRTQSARNVLLESGSRDVQALAKGYADLTAATDKYREVEARLADARGIVSGFGGGGKNPPPKSGGTGGNGAAGLPAGAALAIGIGAVIPMVSDLAGFVAGLGGAFVGMGAAGMLAFKGITAEMKSGSDEGLVYSSLMSTLKDDLASLEQTAAHGVLTGFESAVSSVDNAMPSLTSEVDILSQGLGQVAGITLDGLTAGFQAVNPLINEAQSYIVGLANEWDQWIHSGGLAQWASDAERVFPLVSDTLGTLGQTVLRLVGDLAPLGTGMIQMIDAAAHAADVLSQVVGPALHAVGTIATDLGGPLTAGAAVAGLVAFNFTAVSTAVNKATFGMVDLGGVQAAATAKQIAYNAALADGATAADALAAGETAAKDASGPVGLAVTAVSAVVGGLVAALGSAAPAADGAASAEASYASALQASNGALNDQIRAVVAANLASGGYLQIAKSLGVDLPTLTDAVLGNKSAMDSVNATINANGMVTYKNGIRGTGTEVTKLSGEAQDLKNAIDGQNGALGSAEDQYKATHAAIGGTVSVTQQLTAAQNAATAAATTLQSALSSLGNVNMSEAQAQIAYKQSVADTTATIKKNGATLDENTQKGRDNQSALLNMAKSAVALVAAEQQQGDSEKKVQATMQQSRDAFIKAAMAAGDTRAEAKKLADQYGLIPGAVKTAFQTSGMNTALSQIAALKAAMAKIPRQFVVHFSSNASDIGITSSKIGSVARADGGPIYRAGGGWAAFIPQGTDTVPAMLTPGEFVVKDKSAAYNPQFLKAYNADPAAALASVSHTSGTHVEQHFTNIMQPGTSPAQFARELAWQGRNTGMRR